jgi:hypothetical protein
VGLAEPLDERVDREGQSSPFGEQREREDDDAEREGSLIGGEQGRAAQPFDHGVTRGGNGDPHNGFESPHAEGS